jgi:hypothetical protein
LCAVYIFVIFQTLLPTKQPTDRFTVDEARENPVIPQFVKGSHGVITGSRRDNSYYTQQRAYIVQRFTGVIRTVYGRDESLVRIQ